MKHDKLLFNYNYDIETTNKIFIYLILFGCYDNYYCQAKYTKSVKKMYAAQKHIRVNIVKVNAYKQRK